MIGTITLFDSNATDFRTNGLGGLPDAVTCSVEEEINGIFELEMEYPANGLHFNEIKLRRIILSKVTPYSNYQPFRIYSISTPIDGLVTIKAEHISYDLSGYIVPPFKGNNATDSFRKLSDLIPKECPFKINSQIESDNSFSSATPLSIRTVLGRSQGCFLDVYKGEYIFDGFNIVLVSSRGRSNETNGISIRYGKNMTEFDQDESSSNIYTAVHPYWYSEQDGLCELTGDSKVVTAINANFTRVYLLDLSTDFSEKPTNDQMISKTKEFIKENNIGQPHVSIKVSFVSLKDSGEFRLNLLLERVILGDVVNVIFSELGINAKAECIRTLYDAISDSYIEIELGDAVKTVVDTIVDNENDIGNSPSIGDIHDVVDGAVGDAVGSLEDYVDKATDLITGNAGGYVSLKKNPSTGKPEEIIISDSEKLSDAVNVWRWSNSGLGFSKSGYAGPYETAITSDGTIVADFIRSGQLDANVLSGGVIRSRNGKFEFNLNDGSVKFEELKLLSDSVNKIKMDGVSRVYTSIGLTIDSSGVNIYNPKSNSDLTNTLDDTGMHVVKSKGTSNEIVMLSATSNGVNATNLVASTYLNIGNKIRFESNGDSIACYWIGGGN